MKDTMKKILAEIGKVYPNGPYSWKKGGGAYPGWKTVVQPKLEELKEEAVRFLDSNNILVSGNQPKPQGGGASVSLVPWMTCRVYGAPDVVTKTRQGVYVNYLFGMDGKEVFLVIGLATTHYTGPNFPERLGTLDEQKKSDRISIENLKSESIEKAKTAFLKGALQKGEFKFSAKDPRVINHDWQFSCPYWIRYETNKLPDSNRLKEDLKNMFSLYNSIAESTMPKPLPLIIENIKQHGTPQNQSIELDGVNYDMVVLENMLRNFSIIPYEFGLDAVRLEYDPSDWIRLANHCDFLDISIRNSTQFLSWRDGTHQSQSLIGLINTVSCHRHVILEGPPGVGKTHFLKSLLESGEFTHHTMLTFHASTEYNDFIGGLKPVISTQKVVSPAGMGGMFRVRNKPVLELKAVKGHFLKALEKTTEGKVLIWIDELNRGNVAKIFGELIGLIGTDKPGSPTIRNAGLPDDVLDLETVKLDNLHIVGTINTADRSISHLDAAIRRRFKFVRMKPDYTLPQISDIMESDDGECFKLINEQLREKIGSDGELGHSYLFELKENPGARELIWRYSILPNIADLLIREDSKDLLPEINKNIPADIHYELKKHGTGFSSHIEISRKGQTPDGEEE